MSICQTFAREDKNGDFRIEDTLFSVRRNKDKIKKFYLAFNKTISSQKIKLSYHCKAKTWKSSNST